VRNSEHQDVRTPAEGSMTDTCCMRLVIVTATFLIAALCLACDSPNLATPRPSDGPAFAAISRASTEVCGQDVCVSQDVVNMGNQAGSGECRLQKVDHLGGGKVVEGVTVTLPVVAAGDTTTVEARWKGEVDEGNVFTVKCEPPPLM
jgi:hypothetical protein